MHINDRALNSNVLSGALNINQLTCNIADIIKLFKTKKFYLLNALRNLFYVTIRRFWYTVYLCRHPSCAIIVRCMSTNPASTPQNTVKSRAGVDMWAQHADKCCLFIFYGLWGLNTLPADCLINGKWIMKQFVNPKWWARSFIYGFSIQKCCN